MHSHFLVHQLKHLLQKHLENSTNSGSSCTVTRPPISGDGSVIDANILGITGDCKWC